MVEELMRRGSTVKQAEVRLIRSGDFAGLWNL